MLPLPRPLPDEVIGSVIARACLRTGLPLRILLSDITGTNRTHCAFLLSADLPAISKGCGKGPVDLLLNHTVFPYSVAFMPGQVRQALQAKALASVPGEDSLSSLTKNVSHGVPFRRTCPQCVKEDLKEYGESYWHRSHLLPAVHVCTLHANKLHVTRVPIQGKANTSNMALPHQLEGSAPHTLLPMSTLMRLASTSVELLSPRAPANDDLLEEYRHRALELGFKLVSGDVAGAALAANIRRLFSGRLVAEAGCEIDAGKRQPWPALMVRPGVNIPFATPKHVLMEVFIAMAKPVSLQQYDHYKRPGPNKRDYGRLDTRTAAKVRTYLKHKAEKRERCTVKQMLTDLGIWTSFRHKRHLFPKTDKLVQEFRASNQSARQLGKRQCWRKRDAEQELVLPSSPRATGMLTTPASK